MLSLSEEVYYADKSPKFVPPWVKSFLLVAEPRCYPALLELSSKSNVSAALGLLIYYPTSDGVMTAKVFPTWFVTGISSLAALEDDSPF